MTYRPLESRNTSLHFNNIAMDGEEFLKDIVSSLEVIEKERNTKIEGLIEKVELFIISLQSERLDASGQQLFEKSSRLLGELMNKLHGSSSYKNSSGNERQAQATKSNEISTIKHATSSCSESTPVYTHGIATVVPSKANNEKPAVKPVSESVDLLLLGSTGNGKSATGNSILGKDFFKISSLANTAAKSSPSNIAKCSTVIGNLAVNVIDGPSIHDSGDIDHDFLEHIINSVEESLELCDYAFSTILIVLKFGIRFTKQEAETIRLIKSILGKNVIKEYGICVITYGDNFEHAVEEAAEDGDSLTFEGWLREQTGDVKNLFEECNFRCVLFDNKTKDLNKKLKQVETLIKWVNIKKRYSKEQFLEAEEGLKELILEASIPHVEQQTKDLISEIRHEVQQIDMDSKDDPYIYMSRMEPLLEKLHAHQKTLEEYGHSSSLVDQLSYLLRVSETEIHSKIKQHRMITENKRLATLPVSTAFSLPMEPHGGSFSYGQPIVADIEKLLTEASGVLSSMRSELKRIEEGSCDESTRRQRFNSLLQKLKAYRRHVEMVGQNSSSLNSIVSSFAEVDLEIMSKLNGTPFSFRDREITSGVGNTAAYYPFSYDRNIYPREGTGGIDWIELSGKDEHKHHLAVEGLDRGVIHNVQVFIQIKWKQIRKYLRSVTNRSTKSNSVQKGIC